MLWTGCILPPHIVARTWKAESPPRMWTGASRKQWEQLPWDLIGPCSLLFGWKSFFNSQTGVGGDGGVVKLPTKIAHYGAHSIDSCTSLSLTGEKAVLRNNWAPRPSPPPRLKGTSKKYPPRLKGMSPTKRIFASCRSVNYNMLQENWIFLTSNKNTLYTVDCSVRYNKVAEPKRAV